MASPLWRVSDGLNGAHDVVVTRAPADVAFQTLADRRVERESDALAPLFVRIEDPRLRTHDQPLPAGLADP